MESLSLSRPLSLSRSVTEIYLDDILLGPLQVKFQAFIVADDLPERIGDGKACPYSFQDFACLFAVVLV